MKSAASAPAMNPIFRRSPRRALCCALVALLLFPAFAQATCPPPPSRSGAEVVNPFVTPFVYSPASATYEAYKGFGTSVPPNASATSLGTLAASFDRLDLSASDENRWHTDEDIVESSVGIEWQAFVFYVSAALVNASSLVFHWEGYGALTPQGVKRTYLFAYNFDLTRWDIIANVSFAVRVDRGVDGEVSRNVSSYFTGNQVVFLVGSEQGGTVDLGNVGRPGGNPTPSTFIETDYIELVAYLPTALPEISVPLSYNATVYGQVTFRGPFMIEAGNITIASGGTLTLDHARLAMTGDLSWIRVEAGGSLRLLNGSLITDSPTDIDDGSASDQHYFIEVLSGAELYLEGSRVENAGVPAGPPNQRGLFVGDVTGEICDSALEGRDASLYADHIANLSVDGFEVNNSGGAPALQLANETRIDALGLAFSSLAISPDSVLVVRTAIKVVVEDTSGKPIRGVDLEMTDNGQPIYASAGYGGLDAKTARARDFDDGTPQNVLRAIARVYLGSPVNTTNVTSVSAKYFEWSETRTVSTAAPHVERFVMSLPFLPFNDAAAAKGYDQQPRNYSYVDSFGPGVSLVDFNRDGRLDIFVSGGATRGEVEAPSAEANHLYKQQPNGAFVDVTASAGLASRGATAAAWGDFDNDGFPDLYLVYQGYGTDDKGLLWPGTPNALYRNNGDETFANVTLLSGVGDAGHGSSAAWGDYDGDGLLDLYVGNLGWVLGWIVRNETNVLYHNNGDRSFTDVTTSLGVTGGGPDRSGQKQQLIFLGGDNATPLGRDSPAGAGFTQGVAWLDHDRDGDLDLFVANDFGSSVLYRNDGATFTVVTQQAGLQRVGSARGVAVADIDADGWLDILQANRWVDFVWRNNHDGTFTDIASQLGLDEELPGTTPVPLDFDLDGRVDLFVGGGRISSFHAYAPSFLWQNRGAAGFADLTASAGTATGDNRTMGAAVGDFDGNGMPDLVTANADRRGSLFLNAAPARPWLKVRLTGTASPRDGQGAQVTLLAPGATVGPTQQVGAVGARGSQAPNELLFSMLGPSPAAQPWTLDILWSSGIRQAVSVPAINQVVVVNESSALSLGSIAPVVVPEDTNASLSVNVVSSDPRASATIHVDWSLPTPDGLVTLQGATVHPAFATPGHFVGTVTARDRSGSVANTTVDITVIDTTPPVIAELANATAITGEAVALRAEHVADNDPAFPTGANFTWTFTDRGAPVALYGSAATYSFPEAGEFVVTLTVRDAANNSATGTMVVQVSGPDILDLRLISILLLVLIAAGVAAYGLLNSRKRRLERLERERAEAKKTKKRKPGAETGKAGTSAKADSKKRLR